MLQFDSRVHTAAAAAAKSLQSCPTLCDTIDGSPPSFPHPWDFPGKGSYRVTLKKLQNAFTNGVFEKVVHYMQKLFK